MPSLVRRTAGLLFALAAAAPLAAQTALYDFESLPQSPPPTFPFCLVDDGITGCFTADEVWYGPQFPEPETGLFGTRLHSYFDYFSPPPARMTIDFDRELLSIDFPFKFRPEATVPPQVVSVTAFNGATEVGSCTVPSTIVLEQEFLPTAGQVFCRFVPFTSVEITGDPRFGNLFIDNVRVTATPEPAALLLLAAGLAALGATRSARRRS